MPVRMRLTRHGKKRKPYYHIVIADARAPRDGKFIEKIGMYNPNTNPATIDIDRDLALGWLHKGAQPSNTVRAILSYTGVLYLKHLKRGVAKGAFSEEVAQAKFDEWWEAKSSKVTDQKSQVEAEKIKAIKAQEDAEKAKRLANRPKEEEVAAVVADATPAVEEVPAAEPEAEAPATEPTPEPVVEEPAPEAKPVEEVAAVAAGVVAETVTPSVEPDDLTKIEGIGPKIAEILGENGFKTFGQLSAAPVERLEEILSENSLGSHKPDTWPRQAEMAFKGEWDELKVWQDELDGGKE